MRKYLSRFVSIITERLKRLQYIKITLHFGVLFGGTKLIPKFKYYFFRSFLPYARNFGHVRNVSRSDRSSEGYKWCNRHYRQSTLWPNSRHLKKKFKKLQLLFFEKPKQFLRLFSDGMVGPQAYFPRGALGFREGFRCHKDSIAQTSRRNYQM